MNLRLLTSLLLVKLAACHFDTSTCGIEKECILVPKGCETRNDCRQMFSYEGHEDGWIDIELASSNDVPTNCYMAVAFSSDDSMGSDAVTQCTFPPGKEPSAHFSYNVGKANVVPAADADRIAEEQHLKLIHAHKGDDGMYCHFRQKSGNGENRFVPYLNDKHFIFLARGVAKDHRALDIHALDTNSPNFPYISDKKVNVAEVRKRETPAQGIPAVAVTVDKEVNDTVPKFPVVAAGVNRSRADDTAHPKAAEPEEQHISRATKLWLFRFHGALMVFAWLMLSAGAILSARYLRDHFPTSTPCGLKWWFHIHRTYNLCALPLILISTLLIFIANEWTWKGPSVNKSAEQNWVPGSVHSLFGLIAILVAVINPLNSLLRCAPDTGARPIFNWTHRILGITGIVCAIIALLIAANSFMSLWSDPAWAFAIVIFYVLIAIFTIIAFEIFSYLKSKPSSKTGSMEMRNRSGHQYDDSGRVVNNPPKIINKKPLWATTALYLIFGLFSFCIVATLIIMMFI